MDDFIYMGLNYDQWMNILAATGVCVILFCFWFQTVGWFNVNVWALYIGKLIGFGLISVPLFTRWFMSESLILLSASIIIMVSCFFLFLRRKGI